MFSIKCYQQARRIQYLRPAALMMCNQFSKTPRHNEDPRIKSLKFKEEQFISKLDAVKLSTKKSVKFAIDSFIDKKKNGTITDSEGIVQSIDHIEKTLKDEGVNISQMQERIETIPDTAEKKSQDYNHEKSESWKVPRWLFYGSTGLVMIGTVIYEGFQVERHKK